LQILLWMNYEEGSDYIMNDIFVHSTSNISKNAKIGRGTKIWQYCTVLEGAEIGEDCVLSQNVYIENHSKIGNRVKIKNNVSIYEGVEIDDDVFVGPSAVFTNVLTPRSFVSRKHEFLPTKIMRGATIGANATIICGTTIGRYALIGAGSVVTCDVPPFALFYGVPATHHGYVCACGEIIKIHGKESTCDRCNSRFKIFQNRCEPIVLNFP